MQTFRKLTCKVAGVTFEGRQDLIWKLYTTDPVMIVPEPENPYDKNALTVQVAHEGEIFHVGYLPREIAKEVAPHLEGEKVMAKLIEITGGFEKNDGTVASLGLVIQLEVPNV